MAWTLQSPSWNTWLYGRGRRGLALAISGSQYPVCPLRPCSASRNRALQHPRSAHPAQPARAPPGTALSPALPQLSPALPQLPARRSRSQHSPRRLLLTSQWRRRAAAERFDRTRRLRKKERMPSNRWRRAKMLLLLEVQSVLETKRPTICSMEFLCCWPVLAEYPLQFLPYRSCQSISQSQGDANFGCQYFLFCFVFDFSRQGVSV